MSESTPQLSTGPVERRLSPRGRLHTHAQLNTDKGPIAVTLLDLSQGGAAVLSDVPLQSGVDVEITFSLPYSEATIHAKARVVWSDGMGHGGIQFVNLSDEAQQTIADFLMREAAKADNI